MARKSLQRGNHEGSSGGADSREGRRALPAEGRRGGGQRDHRRERSGDRKHAGDRLAGLQVYNL